MLAAPKPSLKEPLLKLERARRHLRNFEAAVRKYTDGEPYEIWGEIVSQEGNLGDWRIYAKLKKPPPEERWLPMIGDFANNARSALNFLVYQLSLHSEADPQGTEFPIFLEEPKSGSSTAARYANYMRLLTDEQRSIIESEQPWRNGGGSWPLWRLHAMNVPDKHKYFNVVGTTGMNPGVRFGPNHGFYVRRITLNSAPIGEDATEIAALSIQTIAPNASMELTARPICRVYFGTGSPADGELAVAVLRDIHTTVERVIHRFDSFF
jgi:hypothetical protein